VVAKCVGATLEVVVEEGASPAGKMPYLQTEEGILEGINTIVRYICALVDDNTLGGDVDSAFSMSVVDAWVDWTTDLNLASASWLYPVRGLIKAEDTDRDISLFGIYKLLNRVNSHLSASGPFLVGDSLTLADVSVAFTLLELYTTSPPPLNLQNRFPQVYWWLLSLLQREEFISTVSQSLLDNFSSLEITEPETLFVSSIGSSLLSLLQEKKSSERGSNKGFLVAKHKKSKSGKDEEGGGLEEQKSEAAPIEKIDDEKENEEKQPADKDAETTESDKAKTEGEEAKEVNETTGGEKNMEAKQEETTEATTADTTTNDATTTEATTAETTTNDATTTEATTADTTTNEATTTAATTNEENSVGEETKNGEDHKNESDEAKG